MKNTAQILTKSMTESFIMNDKALKNLNIIFSEKNNDRSILASHLLTLLFEKTIPEKLVSSN